MTLSVAILYSVDDKMINKVEQLAIRELAKLEWKMMLCHIVMFPKLVGCGKFLASQKY
jgi:hypothetical protein